MEEREISRAVIRRLPRYYRYLGELLENGVDVKIGYIETHGRAGTEALLQGLPVIPRRKIFYKGKELEEMDLDTIIRVHPEIVIVDEGGSDLVSAVLDPIEHKKQKRRQMYEQTGSSNCGQA